MANMVILWTELISLSRGLAVLMTPDRASTLKNRSRSVLRSMEYLDTPVMSLSIITRKINSSLLAFFFSYLSSLALTWKIIHLINCSMTKIIHRCFCYINLNLNEKNILLCCYLTSTDIKSKAQSLI